MSPLLVRTTCPPDFVVNGITRSIQFQDETALCTWNSGVHVKQKFRSSTHSYQVGLRLTPEDRDLGFRTSIRFHSKRRPSHRSWNAGRMSFVMAKMEMSEKQNLEEEQRIQQEKGELCLGKVIPDSSVSVILLAGGKGKRMGANMPKQYLPLLGQPIALYSLYTFSSMPAVGEIIVVCDPSYRDIFEEANINTPVKFAVPGKERQDSVWSGLQEISETSKLACIHDSARPLVRTSDILQVITDAWTHGAAVLGVPCKATIKEAGGDGFVKKTLDRKTLWEMQTPQVIEPMLLRKGFELVKRERLEVTDDVSIVEYLQHPVLITEGCYTNLKVTTPDDLLVAERILHQRNS